MSDMVPARANLSRFLSDWRTNFLETDYPMQRREQPEKSAPLSQLVHDLNQPLSAISTYAQAGIHMIDNGLADSARLKELFGKIATQCGRATALSQELGKAVKVPSGKESS